MPARTRARRVGYGPAIAKYGGVITTDRVYRSRVREDQARRTRRRALDADTSLFSMRTGEGMKVAKAKGRLRGRQAKLTVRQEAHLAALHAGGDYTPGELAELFRVGTSTVYRALPRVQAGDESVLTVTFQQPEKRGP